MREAEVTQDAVVIGGGFYGSTIAAYLAKRRGLKRIILIEKEDVLMGHASYRNQARVHNGYHYPRSLTTAYRSRVNLPSFVREWPDSVKRDFTALYAVARRNSKLTARQFLRFCRDIGAKVEPADQSLRQLFEPRLIENVFVVEEYSFDATKLASWAKSELKESGVEVLYGATAVSVFRVPEGGFRVISRANRDGEERSHSCRYVFNCTYSGLNQINGDLRGTKNKLKHEIAELALMLVPQALRELAITVMDGPFFSLMPFPPKGMHTLSHVRYTPHVQWTDEHGVNPYKKLNEYACQTRVDRMLRDAVRYLPAVRDAKYMGSLFEVKTVLAKNEGDDGRPILFEKDVSLPGLYSVLGGKIDNIFDVLEKLDGEPF
jgi:glycine/D-amino acid oxidase-like deaminating enzyme